VWGAARTLANYLCVVRACRVERPQDAPLAPIHADGVKPTQRINIAAKASAVPCYMEHAGDEQDLA
jgi:hypothetical protein